MALTDENDDRQAENPYSAPVGGQANPRLGPSAEDSCWRLYLVAGALGVLACISAFLALSGNHLSLLLVQAVAFGFGSGGAVLLAVARRTESPYLRVMGLFVELCAVALLAQAWFRFP